MVDGPSSRVVVMVQKILLRNVENREQIVEGHKPEVGVGIGDLGKQLADRLRGRVGRDGGRHRDGCRVPARILQL